MDLVVGAVDRLISKLGDLLNEEYKLQKGVSEKIESLMKELECAHAALRKVAGVPPDQLEEQVRIWARQVREASYDMEDELDTFLVSPQGDREHTDHKSLFERLKKITAGIYNKLVSGPSKRRKIALTIDDINKTLEEVTKRHRRYTVDSIVSKPSPTSTVDPRLAAMYKEVTELVGIDKSSGDLISMLSLQGDDESKKNMMKMVGIFGVGGLGKTTLAKAVYDKLKADFQCTAFVPVGRNPDLKKVFRDILIELDKGKYMDTKMSMLDERQLIDELREYLGSKRYLVIIDDIWEIKTCETIKLALVKNNSESRVITTSRKLDVVEHADEFYELKPLPFEESRKLFYMRIFGAEGKCHDTQLDEASDKMLKKCGGVPLAIITVASLLVGKSREKWIEVCHSVVFGDKKNQQASDTEWILSLSYYDLPAHLKICLLYLSAYPEDYTIYKDPLIRMWVAEGFVHSKEPGATLFEVGEGYFNALVNRNMVQALQSEWDGIAHGCRLHDMVLDLLRLKSQEENFITISRNTIAEGASSPSSRVRRLVHQGKTLEQTHQDCIGMDLHHVRTFIACGCVIISRNKGLLFRSFQLLRVLALERSFTDDRCNPTPLEHIEKLLHLRYLRLNFWAVLELPEGIGALKFLQTLDVDRARISCLPSSLALLTQLTCLRATTCVPNGVIDKLTSLEELVIRVNGDTVRQFVKDLGKLRELRVLWAAANNVVMRSDLVELAESIGNLHKIRHLELLGFFNNEAQLDKMALLDKMVLPRPLQWLTLQTKFIALSSCINPSDVPNLTQLELWVDEMDERDLKILGRLPELRCLRLQTSSTVTITIHAAEDCCFQKLMVLSVLNSMVRFVLNEDLSVLFTIWYSCGDDDVAFGSKKGDNGVVMPNLRVLEFCINVPGLIRNKGSCDKLGLEYLPSLQKVRAHFWCKDAPAHEVAKEKAALRHAIEAHPNRPTLKMYKRGT